ncbi:hypothetical protein QFZ32_007675 [Streptomyces canus]|nr:hypothetical protein [Streptomyces canus]
MSTDTGSVHRAPGGVKVADRNGWDGRPNRPDRRARGSTETCSSRTAPSPLCPQPPPRLRHRVPRRRGLRARCASDLVPRQPCPPHARLAPLSAFTAFFSGARHAAGSLWSATLPGTHSTVARASVTGRPSAAQGASSTAAASGASSSGPVGTRKSSPPMRPTRAGAGRRVLQQPSRRADELVARREPGSVVDLLEVVDVQPAQRERPPGRDTPVHLNRDRVRTRQPRQRIEPGRLLHPGLARRPYEIREQYDPHAAAEPVDHGHVVRRTVVRSRPYVGDHVQDLPRGGVDPHRPWWISELRGVAFGVQGVSVAARHRRQETRPVHRAERHPVSAHEQNPDTSGAPVGSALT